MVRDGSFFPIQLAWENESEVIYGHPNGSTTSNWNCQRHYWSAKDLTSYQKLQNIRSSWISWKLFAKMHMKLTFCYDFGIGSRPTIIVYRKGRGMCYEMKKSETFIVVWWCHNFVIFCCSKDYLATFNLAINWILTELFPHFSWHHNILHISVKSCCFSNCIHILCFRKSCTFRCSLKHTYLGN